ncbi:uncharacterized protein LOC118749015 isoform X3 [Rhagoletis pomonella]|uniref:uncharacterized protein LOC118749015 isoform X3 n=1 Tax=Rhagoletis pomonella TaxID=28610 RepID=UPI001784D372|nr:uncharacterized protein LOC118749015 isoform X3 [Rhagoletis pomonella]
MAIVYETVENWGLKKCGEISTLLAVGKEEFFLSCEFCDYTAIQLDRFIRHMCGNHLAEFTKAKSRQKSPELPVELRAEEVGNQWENSNQDSVDKDYALRGFERVEIELDTMDVEGSLEMKEEDISDEFLSETENEETFENINKRGSISLPPLKSGQFDKDKKIMTKYYPNDEEKQFIIEFIELYRSLPSLWDFKHYDYSNRNSRAIQYDIMLAKYKEKYPKADRKEVMKKINSLRSNYRRELKRITPNATPSLYYFEAMDFLRNNDQGEESQNLINDFEESKSTFGVDKHDAKMEVFDTTTKSDSFNISEDTFQEKEIGVQENANVQEEDENFETVADEKKFIIEFIELYQSLPALWDVKSKDYKDRELKDIQYQILLAKYKERYPDADRYEMRKKINTLRSSFRRQAKRPYPPNLYYYNSLSFLLNIDESLQNDFEDNTQHSFKTEDDAGPSDEICKSESESEMDDEEYDYIGDTEQKRSERKFVIELIKVYQSLPPLWDITNKDYHNRAVKNKKYDILLAKYRERYPDADRDDVKRRINSLRSNFRRESKRETTNLFYYDAMSFLLSNYEHSLEEELEETVKSENNSEFEETEQYTYMDTEEDSIPTSSKGAQQDFSSKNERDFTLEFIGVYRSLPALWNVKCKDYHDRNVKKKQYEILLQKFQERYPDGEIKDVKKKINGIRCNYLRECKRISPNGVTTLYYFDAMNFLRGSEPSNPTNESDETEEAVDHNKKISSKPQNLLCDAQFIEFAKIYKTHPCLWNENEITYRFPNRRREALENILHEMNAKFELNLTNHDLEKEITRLRKICSYEKNQKIECKQNKSIYEPTCRFYEHLAFAEIDVRPFECPVCGNLLPSQSQYKKHVASHDGSLPYKCIVCGHGFLLLNNFTVHLRRHAQDYNYSCEVCSRPIATTSELKCHMLTHTGEKPYVCDICGKSSRLLNEFKEHLLRHEQRRIHKCSICPKAFYNRGKLKDHMAAVHVKVRNKICNVCNKGFTTQKQLRQHEHIHDAERKYVCKICGKRFSQAAGLSGHVKSHGTSLSALSTNFE